jgi:hypothetical protein
VAGAAARRAGAAAEQAEASRTVPDTASAAAAAWFR